MKQAESGIKQTSLNSRFIYFVEYEGKGVLYAPLAGVTAIADVSEVIGFESSLSNGCMPDELRPLVGYSQPDLPAMPDDVDSLIVLINQKCNFACKYCYSAGGRSSVELDCRLFPVIVDWFITKRRLEVSNADCLTLTFSGGGDPTLSMNGVKTLVTMMRRKADELSVPLRVGLVCNGSRLGAEEIDFLSSEVDDIVVSFDVIREVHEAQRSHYDVVARTIHELCERGLEIGLRSTITSLNVNRISEMVETIHCDFPGCRFLAAETVLAPEMWGNKHELSKFYHTFVSEFFRAKSLAGEYGIELGNSVALTSNGIKSRACPGKVVITPNGMLTACSRVAMLGDSHYERFIFGKVDENGLDYDNEKYSSIMSERADAYEECQGCFARFHCGGGCLLARLSYNREAMEAHCEMTRQMLKQELFHDLG